MRLVSVAGARLRRAAEEEERKGEREREPPPSHHSNHQFASMKNKFFNELTHLPSEHTQMHTCTCKIYTNYTLEDNVNTFIVVDTHVHTPN